MLSLFFLVLILTIYYVSLINGCSQPLLVEGTYYISQVQLLDATIYPDSVLLEIYKARDLPLAPEGPTCKIMNVNDGSVGDVVKCDDYSKLIRNFDVVDIDTTNTMVITCKDKCDGLSAICNIIKNSKSYLIKDVPFLSSDTSKNCNPYSGGNYVFFVSFTINDVNLSTTYIVFETNMVGFIFDDLTESFDLINVEPVGDFNDLKLRKFMTNINPMIYSSSNIIQNALPCCLCPSYSLYTYNIEDIDDDPTNEYDQIFTIISFKNHGGHVDAVKSRVYHWGISSNTVNIYHVSDDSSVQYEPDLEP